MSSLRFIPLIAVFAMPLTVQAEESKPSPAAKRILDKAAGEVKKNRRAFDKANEKPLDEARKALEKLSTELIKDGKAEEATAILKLVGTLEGDVMRLANTPETNSQKTGPSKPALDDDGRLVWKGHKYKLFFEKCTWHDAKKRCEELGGHLVTIITNEEQAVVLGLLVANAITIDQTAKDWSGPWIGATDEVFEGQWKWVDGSRVTYGAWMPGAPDGLPNNHCAFIAVTHGGGWDDAASDRDARPFICEWEK